jgi:transposase InsO family protein
MKLHGSARTCPNSRRLLVQRILVEGWSLTEAARAAGVSDRTARKWVGRFREEGERGLFDRSSAPKRTPHKVPAQRVAAIEALRRLRLTAAEIAELLGMALSTVSLWLKRIGLGKRSRLAPPEPPNRYERARPGELVHIDVKKLGRILAPGHRVLGRAAGKKHRRTIDGRQRNVAGWECVHVCVDDATRLAYVEVLPDERGETAAGFLRRAVTWFAERGVIIERVMTDNGSPYISTIHALTCRELGIRHLRTRPYRPRTNGKAERFIQTLLRDWAYNGRLYGSSLERTAQLVPWLSHYNFRRPHGSLGHRPPAARLGELTRNEVVGNYT